MRRKTNFLVNLYWDNKYSDLLCEAFQLINSIASKRSRMLLLVLWTNEFSRALYPSPAVSALVAHLQTGGIQQNPLYHVPMPAWNCATICRVVCFPIHSTSFSPFLGWLGVKLQVTYSVPLPSADYKDMWILWERKQKACRRKLGHSAMLCPPSETACQTHSKM